MLYTEINLFFQYMVLMTRRKSVFFYPAVKCKEALLYFCFNFFFHQPRSRRYARGSPITFDTQLVNFLSLQLITRKHSHCSTWQTGLPYTRLRRASPGATTHAWQGGARKDDFYIVSLLSPSLSSQRERETAEIRCPLSSSTSRPTKGDLPPPPLPHPTKDFRCHVKVSRGGVSTTLVLGS